MVKRYQKKTQRGLLTVNQEGNWLTLKITHSSEIKDSDIQIILQKSPALKRLCFNQLSKSDRKYLGGIT